MECFKAARWSVGVAWREFQGSGLLGERRARGANASRLACGVGGVGGVGEVADGRCGVARARLRLRAGW
jgi:hypothetical protein